MTLTVVSLKYFKDKLLNAEGELQQYSRKEQKLLNSYHEL